MIRKTTRDAEPGRWPEGISRPILTLSDRALPAANLSVTHSLVYREPSGGTVQASWPSFERRLCFSFRAVSSSNAGL